VYPCPNMMKYSILLIAFIFANAVAAQVFQVSKVKGYTLDAQGQLQQFSNLIFTDGKVLALGGAELSTQFPQAIQIDGKGKTLLPGLIDAHGHLLALGESLLQVDLRGVESATQGALSVREYADLNKQLDWITGFGWNQVLWPSKTFPTASQLDEYINDRPVWLRRIDGHAGWANSKALKEAGISRDTLDPPGGKILRDKAGNPSGVLIDNAMELLTPHLPRGTKEIYAKQLHAAAEHLLSVGLTSIHDAGIDEGVYDFYQQMAATKSLPVRIYAMLSAADPALEALLEKGFVHSDDDYLSIRSVKAYGDGALGSRGAALLTPYADATNNAGLLLTREKDLEPLFEQILGHGFQLNFHAIGDRANRLALDHYASAFEKVGGRELRNRIEHAQVVSLQDIPRFKLLDIIPSMQPTHATSDMNMAEDRLGKERLKGAYAWQRFLKQGSPLAFGSDFPIELANPFHGLHAAVTRQNHQGQPQGGWHSEEALSVRQAFRAFTVDAAYAAHQETILGSLEVGKWADFILLDQDIFTIDARQIWQTQVLETWIAGQRRYKKVLPQ
jgi:predicted amidohydrolase YtcJ